MGAQEKRQMQDQDTTATTLMLEKLVEAWGDIVDPPPSDTVYTYGASITNLRDRMDGRYLPVYETEWDVRTIAMMGRLLHERVPMGKAKTYRLRDYTIGSGFDWNITHDSPAVTKAATELVDRFFQDNRWQEEWERESFVQECVDGNWLAEIAVEDGQLILLPMYLDNLVEPLNARQLEEYYDIDYPASWSFGILSHEQRAHIPKGYHIVRDEGGMDWSFIPRSHFVHWKRNVPPTAKMGVSDHYTPHLYLGRADKVLGRTAEGAAVQAAIAYVVEHGEDTTQSQVSRIPSGLKNVSGTNEVTGLAERRMASRSGVNRIDTYNGAKYHAGPLGDSGRQAVYMEVMEGILRLSGTPDAIPEYMMTGSAENNNFASIKESGSPFVQGRKADQSQRKQRVERLIKQLLAIAADAGLLRSAGVSSYAEIEPGIEVTVSPPDIYSRDAETADIIAQLESKLISRRTATNKLGNDYEDEQAQIEDENAGNAGLGADQGLPGAPSEGAPEPETGTGKGAMAGLNRQQWKRNRAAINDILQDHEDGTITPTRAVSMLTMLGISKQAATELIGEEDDEPTPATVAEQILRESWDEYHSRLLEHLPGKHNQKAHAHKGTGKAAEAPKAKAKKASSAPSEGAPAKPPKAERKVKATEKPGTAPEAPVKSAKSKSAIAKASQKRTGKKVQDHAAANEKWLAEQFSDLDSVLHGDSKPSDVDTKHGHIEIKTMKEGANGKVTMNLYAQVLKVNMEKETTKPFHTIVIDDTQPGQRGFYYRRGIAGSARMTAMHPVSSVADLADILAMPEDQLPANAQRSDAKLFVGEWVPVAPGERALINTVTGKIAKPKK